MKTKQLFLGIDSGTQGTKVIVFDEETGTIVADAYASHKLTENANGRREQHPHWWIKALEEALKSLFRHPGIKAKEIKAIGVSGQQHGMVPLDKSGNVIRPAKLWCDTETTDQCHQITTEIGGDSQVIEYTGNTMAVGYTASKVLWLKQHEPENYDRLDCILLPHDYLNYWLSGEKKTEYGDASGTAYFDVKSRMWSDVVLTAIDSSGKLISCLPDLVEPWEPVGKIRNELVLRYGFSSDVLIAAGGGDNMMAAIGTGNVIDGIVTASLGTSGTIYSCSSNPIVDDKGELAAFCSSSGSWLPLVCTMNVTVSTELTRKLLNLSLQELNEHAARAPIGADGILLIPYFNGERTPALPHATASYSGLTSTNYTRENVCRATMEGATLGLKYGLGVLQRNGIAASEIRLVGGGAKSSLWRQLVADIFNCRVICPVVEEAGALGAALQAVWCYHRTKGVMTTLKEITDRFVLLEPSKAASPIAKNVDQYLTVYRNYLTFGKALEHWNQ
jgi:D-xylulose kinase